MNLHEYPQFHGHTLAEIAETTGIRRDGYAVFAILREDDPLGDEVGMGFSVADIIRQAPEMGSWVVKYSNDYLGMVVLRAERPAEG